MKMRSSFGKAFLVCASWRTVTRLCTFSWFWLTIIISKQTNMKLAPLALAALAALTITVPEAKAGQGPTRLADIRLMCRRPTAQGIRTAPCAQTLLQMAGPHTGPGTHAGRTVARTDGKGVVTVTGYCPKGFNYVPTNGPVGYRCRDNGTLNVLHYYGGNGIKTMFAMGILPPIEKDVRQMWTVEDAVAAAEYRAMCRKPGASSNWQCRTIVPGWGVFNPVTGEYLHGRG